MQDTIRRFAAGFFLTAILIGTLCGFMLVDLSTERYMPGRFGPLLLVTSVDGGGMELSFLGEEYHISAEPAGRALSLLEPYHALLPLHIQIAQALGGQLHQALDRQEEPALLWEE